jgi:cytochrome P450
MSETANVDTRRGAKSMECDPASWETQENPYPVDRWFRDEAPVYHNDRLGFWALSRLQDVWDATPGVQLSAYFRELIARRRRENAIRDVASAKYIEPARRRGEPPLSVKNLVADLDDSLPREFNRRDVEAVA